MRKPKRELSARGKAVWSFPSESHPPDGFPYSWPDTEILKALIGKRVHIGGVHFTGWKTEFDAIILGVEWNRLTLEICKPEFRNLYAIQDLETGEVYKCKELT
jgi:hypothetical protein